MNVVKPPPVCWMCGATDWGARHSLRERMFGMDGTFDYRTCGSCGSLQIDALPDDLAAYYPAGYYSFSDGEAGRGPLVERIRRMRDEHALFGSWGALGRWLEERHPYPEMRSLSALPGLHRGLRILDVGSGGGALLKRLRRLGFTSVLGVDPFVARDIEWEGRLLVRRGEVSGVEGEWDAVMLHHALEHIPEPFAVMRECAARLAAGGALLVRTPVVPNALFEEYDDCWVGLDAPRHVFIPSIEGLRRLGERAGLRVLDVVYDSSESGFWASEQYRLGIVLRSAESYLTNPAAFPASRIRAWRNAARALNASGRGDQAAVTFVRQ